MQPPMPAETGRIAWHVITAELHTGMLTLAFASLVIRLVGVWATSGTPVWRGLVRLAEPTAVLAAIGGLLALIASIVTGLLYTWPVEVLLTSSVVLNKIAITAFATTFWMLFVVVRLIYGGRLWDRPRLRWLSFALGAGGFVSLMLVGSTGGHLAGKRSMLDGVLHYLGVNTHLLFTLSRSAVYLALSAVALLVVGTAVRRAVWSWNLEPRALPGSGCAGRGGAGLIPAPDA